MRRLSLPSPSMAIALTALSISLGGTSYAAMKIGSADVRNNSLTGQDIKNSSLTSADVKNASLTAKDFKAGQLPAGAKGDTGPTGAAGPAGTPGATGPAGAGRWVLVAADGTIEAQSGGFSIANAYGSNGAPAGASENVYINAGEDLSNNAIVATIALQNQLDQNGDMIKNGKAAGPDLNPEFSGEITATRCGIATVVSCAPTGTNNANHLVVSPRLSDGSPTDPTTRKRFYVVISGTSTDLT